MRKAVLVAASQFHDRDAFPLLKFPVKDAESLKSVLLDSALCYFDDVALIANEDQKAALSAIERMTRGSTREDLLLFYYSGHGQLDADGSLALALPETDRDCLSSTSLAIQQIKHLFRISRARQKVMILDCCYAGAAVEGEFKGGIANSIAALAQDLEANIQGSYLLTASRRFEPAFESTGLTGGALTACLVTGITTGAAGSPDSDAIRLSDLADYVRREVPTHGAQQPQCFDLGGVGNLLFAKRPQVFDSEWAQNARRMVSRYEGRDELAQEQADEIRAVIACCEEAPDEERLALVAALLRKKIKLGPFLHRWHAATVPPPAVGKRAAPTTVGGVEQCPPEHRRGQSQPREAQQGTDNGAGLNFSEPPLVIASPESTNSRTVSAHHPSPLTRRGEVGDPHSVEAAIARFDAVASKYQRGSRPLSVQMGLQQRLLTPGPWHAWLVSVALVEALIGAVVITSPQDDGYALFASVTVMAMGLFATTYMSHVLWKIAIVLPYGYVAFILFVVGANSEPLHPEIVSLTITVATAPLVGFLTLRLLRTG